MKHKITMLSNSTKNLLIFNCPLSTKAQVDILVWSISMIKLLSLTTKSFINHQEISLYCKRNICCGVSTIYEWSLPLAQDLEHIRYPINSILLLSSEMTSSAHIGSLLCPFSLASVPYESLSRSCQHHLRAPHSLPWFCWFPWAST